MSATPARHLDYTESAQVLRPDLKAMAELVPQGSTVIDIGCGEGDLLHWLLHHKKVTGRGIEISQPGVSRCISRGLSVIQGDADFDLQYYPNQAYDYAILSQTLQTLGEPKTVLEHMVRIAKHAIVGVPNFGHWRNRLYLLTQGRMPVTSSLSYTWYETPNIHFCTIADFIELCETLNLKIEYRASVSPTGKVSPFKGKGGVANLCAEHGVFMLSR